ncbi:Protein of unknown function (DUF2921 [Striga hermonthica]|uniref:RING-type E3 ubiquitin transferase n=1 Tax=Striga hermonthica TaxID=68872 RepID=A0A9N7NN54_STRHE|nr:Protein of unknown function (DUF2921 [Striga hermonthica]
MPSIAASWALFGLSIVLCIDFAYSYDEATGSKLSENRYKFDRITEVNKECAFVLKSASQLKPDDSRLVAIKEELSFLNGDWWQDSSAEIAPLMPFDDRESTEDLRSPSHLVSFWVTGVNRHYHSKNSVSVSGLLQLGISLEGLLSEEPYEKSPRFDIWPGHSQLSINFQGIYTEKSHGERVMCLLGSTVLPTRGPKKDNPWPWVKEFGYTDQPLLTEDDQIMLVLHFPKTMTLTSREIMGSMKSLNSKSNSKYFVEVHLSSWLSPSVNYHFTSGHLVSKACDPYPFKDDLNNGEIDIYRGLDFCVILERFTRQEALTILPNWKCNGTDLFCRKLGPFVSNKEINATDGSFKNVKLILQDIRCENITQDGSDGSQNGSVGPMRVFSVFRAVPPSQNIFTAAHRTGLRDMTISAEGIWKPSNGQLCMIGCSRFDCDTRICMYIPLSFSIKQRSILFGTFSSISSAKNLSFFPLTFEKIVRPAELWDQYTASRPYYKYTKIRDAGFVLEKDEPFNFGTVVWKSALKFPKIEEMENFPYSLSLLSEDLTLHVPALPDPIPSTFLSKNDFELEILSIGPLFGPYWPAKNVSNFRAESPYATEKQLLVNVSGQLSLAGQHYKSNFSSLFLEGIYDPHVGKMYLVGCRDIRAGWRTLYESMDLEAGLDCLVQVVISYPPVTARWLVDPTARISIGSQRNEDDPLYFDPINLQTVPILYRKQREDILSRRGVEGVLRISTLSVAIACILSQLIYVREKAESVPYVSFVMLGVQAVGYGLPLVTGAGALLRKRLADFSENESHELKNSQWIHMIDYAVKVLVLIGFALTLTLSQKVWKARIKLLMQSPLEPHRVPSEKKVLLSTLIILVLGYVLVLVVHYVNTSYKPLQTVYFVDWSGYSRAIREWETVLGEYFGLVQDFFLLPQVIANFMWRIQDKPLGMVYFSGLTSVRLFPHLYDYISAPVQNPYLSEEYEFVNPQLDFYSKIGDVAILLTAVLLAIAVYVQQRWGYERLGQMLVLVRGKFLPMGSKVYERLPSVVPFETELSCGVGSTKSAIEKDPDME